MLILFWLKVDQPDANVLPMVALGFFTFGDYKNDLFFREKWIPTKEHIGVPEQLFELAHFSVVLLAKLAEL